MRYARAMDPVVEAELSRLIHARTFDRAATECIRSYGAEIYGFLVSQVGNENDAAEVFSQLGEDLWRGLPGFGLRCTVRTWLYLLARHAAERFRRGPWNREGQRTGDSGLDALVAAVRTSTQPWLRTDVKDRWRTLRESLGPDDRALLTLRVDRKLPWIDIARITLESEAPGAGALARETARLRKRFQLLKGELRHRAREAGLLDQER